MKFIAIIPARYASSRFPGKPLADLCGKPVIERVYLRVHEVFDEVCVATDDERIAAVVRNFGGHVVMTRTDHKSGTDRICEAYHKVFDIHSNFDADVVVNVQGDEPFVAREQLELIKSCFNDPATDIATLAMPITIEHGTSELFNPNNVKVVFSEITGKALYFSRSAMPYARGVEQSNWLGAGRYYKHIGIYAYRANVLDEITKLPQSPLEITESLEQLRWLENGYQIAVRQCNVASIGIDTPEDLEQARQYMLGITQ